MTSPSGPVRLPGALVDGAWLAANLAGPDAQRVAVADVRWYLDGRSGREAHRAGHIPGAVWLNVDTDLSGPVGPGSGRHPLPSPGALLAALDAVGIPGHAPVVAYDDASGSIAARLWWMLHALGREVAVLDGGIASWPGALETGERPRPSQPGATARAEPPGEWPAGLVVGTDEVDAARRSSGVVVLDARSAERYAGAPNPADPRPGHIPGARSAPWQGNLDPGTGRFAAPGVLRRRFDDLGVGPGTDVVASCGSGVTACHDLLALHLAGHPGAARLYPGSWSAWAADPDRPVATGAEPG